MLLIATCKNTKNSIFLKLKNPITMHIAHVIVFLFLLKIREIFIFNIMFTAFIKILPVGELPSHNHTATISTTNLTGWFTNNGNSDTANGDGTIFKASKRTGQGSSSGGAADGGKFTFNGAHAHTITINNSGSNQSHNNIQPYISVYMWKRSA